MEGKKYERHLWVNNEGPVGDERSSRGHKSLCETFAEGFALVEELGRAGVSAALLGLGGEKGGLGCRKSLVRCQRQKQRNLGSILQSVGGEWKGPRPLFQSWISFLAAFMKGEKGQM